MKPGKSDLIRTLLSRCASLLRARKLDADLDEELRAHIDFAADEHIQRGMTPQQAHTAALREFGGVTQIKETYRVKRGLPWLGQLGRDLRFAARQLHRSPGFATTAILTLALGLGANTAVFSLINALLLRPLPVPHAEQLAVVRSFRSDNENFSYFFSNPMFRAVAQRREAFDSVAAFSRSTLQVRSGVGTVQIPGALVSGEFFTMLEMPPLKGRILTAADDREGSPGVYCAVISEGFWKNWFNGAPDIVGRTLTIAGQSFSVVGVMPKAFIGADPTHRPDIFLPIQAEPVVDAPYSSLKGGYQSFWLNILARRRSGVTLEQASAALAAASNAVLEESIPDAEMREDNRKNHFRLAAEPGTGGFTYLRETFRKPLTVVMALCGGILLLACLNLASLLMARSAARERELATRLALGASRGRLVQQLLMESLMIAALGTTAGLAAAPVVSHGLAVLLLGHQRNVTLDTSPDLQVLGFATLLTAVAAILIGLLPALRATGGRLNEQMKRGGQIKAGQGFGRDRHRWMPRLLMSSEVALALMIVVGAGLMAASLTRLYRTGLGFDPKGLVNLELDMDKQPLEGAALLHWYQQFSETLGHLPGLENVTYAGMTPISGGMEASSYKTPYSNGDQEIYGNQVGPAYFATMRIPLRAGREFRWEDTNASGDKIILNETAAKTLFPGRSALGQIIPSGKSGYEVIGVVADAHYLSVRGTAPPTAYRPITQTTQKKGSYIMMVRLTDTGQAVPLADAARKLVAQTAPEAPAPVMTTMSSQIDDSISSERMMAMLSVFFAVCALLVTAIGLYGTLAYATARRTSEIGIRMALGAQRAQVVAFVFRENAWVAACGSLAGLVAALLASRMLASFLYGTSVRDPWVLLASVAALISIASAASLLPALRASRIEPMAALRTE
jgi:predicted permease